MNALEFVDKLYAALDYKVAIHACYGWEDQDEEHPHRWEFEYVSAVSVHREELLYDRAGIYSRYLDALVNAMQCEWEDCDTAHVKDAPETPFAPEGFDPRPYLKVFKRMKAAAAEIARAMPEGG